MRKKLLVLVLLIAGLAGLGVIRSASKSKQARDDQADNRGTFRQRLDRAKARGDKKLTAHTLMPIYAQVDLDTALAMYDLVIAEPISWKSIQGPDGEEGIVETWYKFKVIESLSKAKTLRPLDLIDLKTVPSELLPLAEDEILVSKLGGVVNFEGVEIENKVPDFPKFELSHKYLFFLAFDPTKRAGYVEVGPSGVLMVNEDGTMESVNKDRRYFQTKIEARFGRSINKLRQIHD